jgi:geranylgeranyl reductase
MNNAYDAVVVGGGPSGAIAAKTLAAAGVKVSLLEKSFKRKKPCGGATPAKSFEEFKLPQKEITRKIDVLSSISPYGQRLDISLDGGYIAMVERGSFDESLRKQAGEAGAEVMEAEFIDVKETQEKLCVTISEQGKERDVVSDFVIAADGINSRVARSVGLKPLPGVYTIQEKLDMKAAEDFSSMRSCEFWFGSSHAPRFYSWVFPKKDYIDIGTGTIQGKLLKDFMNIFKIRRCVYGKGRQQIYRVPLRCRDSLVKDNIVFVGDAAGFVMPLSYEGLYYAMKSGKMAADAIVKGVPADYEKKWNRTFRSQFTLMNRLKFFVRHDRATEHMFRLHEKRDIQTLTLRLFLKKEISISKFIIYLKLIRRLLG